MASLSSPPISSATNSAPSILQPPTLLIRAPTFRKPDRTALRRPSTPPTLPAPGSSLRQPSPTPSHKSSYSVDLPTYDDYEHIPQLPSPPRASSSYHGAHSRSASVPHNDYLDPEFLELTSATSGRSRAQSHQRSRTELLPAFVSQTLRRTLSRSPARSIRNSPCQSRSPSPDKFDRSGSLTLEKGERSESDLSVRGGAIGFGGIFGQEDEMLLTGDNRVTAAARRRAAASTDLPASSNTASGGGALITATPASPAPSTVKGLGSWISGAAATVSATVTQSIGVRPALDRQRSDSGAQSLKTISSGLEGRDSIRNAQVAPATPQSASKSNKSTTSSLRPAPAAPAPSFGGAAKATFTSIFRSSSATPASAAPSSFDPLDDELCTLDLLTALPPAGEGTSPTGLHKTAMELLRRYQKQYKARTQQVQALKQEAEVRDEELEGHTVRSKSLKAQLEAMSRTIQDRDDTLRAREQMLKEALAELREKQEFLDRIAGPETPIEELDAEEAERRRESRTTGDSESIHGSIFSGMATAVDTPITNTTTTSSASSIRSSVTPRPEQRSRLSLLSCEDLEKQSSLSSTSKMVKDKDRCENCQGKSSSQAWIALSSVRSENQGLKQKCTLLEEGIDGALGDLRAIERERGMANV